MYRGVHIVIRRDHRRQFLSCLRQAAKGNAYFIERPWVILGANRDHTAFVPLRQIVDMPAFDGPAIQRNAAYAHYARHIDARALYLAFYFLHLLAVRDNVAQCDLVLDIDRISTDARARRLAEAQIDALTGCPISFADCYIQTYDDQLAWAAAHFAALDALLG